MEQVTTRRYFTDLLTVLELFHTDDTLFLAELVYRFVSFFIFHNRDESLILFHHISMNSILSGLTSCSSISSLHFLFSSIHLIISPGSAISLKVSILLLTQPSFVMSLNVPSSPLSIAEKNATDAHTAQKEPKHNTDHVHEPLVNFSSPTLCHFKFHLESSVRGGILVLDVHFDTGGIEEYVLLGPFVFLFRQQLEIFNVLNLVFSSDFKANNFFSLTGVSGYFQNVDCLYIQIYFPFAELIHWNELGLLVIGRVYPHGEVGFLAILHSVFDFFRVHTKSHTDSVVSTVAAFVLTLNEWFIPTAALIIFAFALITATIFPTSYPAAHIRSGSCTVHARSNSRTIY